MNFEKNNQRLIDLLIDEGALKTKRIIEAFKTVPRHKFILKKYISNAYGDYPLPTLCGQTISQPYTVAVMLEALEPKSENKVLEIGTGSGWTAGLLTKCVGEKGRVVTIDIFQDLIKMARKNLKKFDFKNIKIICGDGKEGYPKEAPYDRVLINAACDEIPESLIEQTKIGGKIVAPVNGLMGQKMIVAEKQKDGKLKKKSLGSFVFVPLR